MIIPIWNNIFLQSEYEFKIYGILTRAIFSLQSGCAGFLFSTEIPARLNNNLFFLVP